MAGMQKHLKAGAGLGDLRRWRGGSDVPYYAKQSQLSAFLHWEWGSGGKAKPIFRGEAMWYNGTILLFVQEVRWLTT